MKNRILRAIYTAMAVSALALLVGCSKEDTGTVKDEAKKIDDGLKGQPPVPDELKGMDLSDKGAPPKKAGAGGGGP